MAEKSGSQLAQLRETLFETIDKVKSGEMELGRAKTIGNLAQVIVNTASAQVRAANAMGERELRDEDNFFGVTIEAAPEPKRLNGGVVVEANRPGVTDPLRVVKPAPEEEPRRKVAK